MHPNFYHWHSLVDLELKSDTSRLEPRWDASAKFVEELSGSDILSLLRLFLFSKVDDEFAKRFTEWLVKAEPTFPSDVRPELLRVMAAAAIFSQMEDASNEADALALGLQASAFPQNRIQPVTQEIMVRATQYIAEESERIRPQIDLGTIDKTQKQTEANSAALKKAVESNELAQIGKATEVFSRGVAAALKESHDHFRLVVGRLAEESQFLWWLIGRRSSSLALSRTQLTADAYAFQAASEAAVRVNSLPPAPSVESLLAEVLSHCSSGYDSSATLLDFVKNANPQVKDHLPALPPELAPISALLRMQFGDGEKPKIESLKKLGITGKVAKFTPTEIAVQYFRELMFARVMDELT